MRFYGGRNLAKAERDLVLATLKQCSNNRVQTAKVRMSAGKFRHMPVVDQGRLVGMVSIGDVVKHRLHAMERDSAAMRDYIVTA